MQLIASIANALWAASNLPAYQRFRLALRQPQFAQRRRLENLLKRNAQTAFGKAHRFDAIRGYEEFAQRVPLSDYDNLAPWIRRVRQGEQSVLTAEPVTHLIPTSGSTGGRKLIPFTAGLQREFNAAIGPWIVDLMLRSPGLIGGPAYWSITPAMRDLTVEESAVPVGFDTDTAYLGGRRRRLAETVMAVPAAVASARSLEAFRYQTLLHLLLCRDLRLISVWHPSFLLLLLESLPEYWGRLLAAIECGTDSTPARRERARELRRADPFWPETLWPSLRVISCWADGAAALAVDQLRHRFPHVRLQPKGLIATEAFISLPFDGRHPVAVRSHFFEFIDAKDRVHPVESLQAGEDYEVVVTTAGGLWRYRLGDRVQVLGFVEQTPSLRFLGRNGNVSDLFGEKLTERFVAEVLQEVFGSKTPRFALLAPDRNESGCRYTLYVEGEAALHWSEAVDGALRRNPHYALCRDLGQLLPVRVFAIAGRAYEAFARQQASNGARLGDIKPAMLNSRADWSKIFPGEYPDKCKLAPQQVGTLL